MSTAGFAYTGTIDLAKGKGKALLSEGRNIHNRKEQHRQGRTVSEPKEIQKPKKS